MEKESDYIKRSIELYKYTFSSSAGLLLIIGWKILSEINVVTEIKANMLLAILIFLVTSCVAIICMGSFNRWMTFVEKLK